MGEVISLSQYRKERIREASSGRSSELKVRYGLIKSGKSDGDSAPAKGKNDLIKGVVEFQGKETDTPDSGPEDAL